MIEPGSCSYNPAKQQILVDKAEGQVKLSGYDYQMFMRDMSFAASVTEAVVPHGFVAVLLVNERPIGYLESGEYCFWNVLKKHTFQLFDMTSPESSQIPREYLNILPAKLCSRIEVNEGECALLYFDGAFQRVLSSGAHCFWNTFVRVTAKKIDLRTRQMDVQGQEILTADKVGLRINFVCSYRVTDPVKAAGELADYEGQIYTTIQLALRRYVGQYRLDELLEQKQEVADFVLKKLQEEQARFFVEFQEAGIRDIILPGEIRNIMNTVLIAEKTAQANVIARREEVASTRSLLNTAKLLEENETLRRLKELEYLERICDKVGNISVSNGGNLLTQLRELLASTK